MLSELFILFIKGLIIGFSIAAPVGPIGVLCINRSLHEGWKVGFATGLGAAIADGVYGAIAGFGLTFISTFLISQQYWIKLIGGIFLLYLGVKTLTSKPPKQIAITDAKTNLFRAFATTFFLTLTNPMTILSFVAVFAGLGLGSVNSSYLEASVMIVGIIIGSLLWWILLSGGIAMLLRHRVDQMKLGWVNIFSGTIIFIFGVIALASR